MKERALKKISGRILMVHLLGNNASNAAARPGLSAAWISQERLLL
jgi:hypothetical protein